MKWIFLLLIPISFFAQAQTGDDFTWLAGTWNRTPSKAGRTAHERWIKTADGLHGWGISMNGADTAFVEKLRIVMQEGKVYYVAEVPQNKTATYFLITAVTTNGFVCENPQHDFPKKITYLVEGNRLRATISGDGKSIDYFFVREE